MAGACILVGLALPNSVADVVELVAMVAAGAVTYLTAVRVLAPTILPELVGSLTGTHEVMKPLVDVMLIGAQKSGTTALAQQLGGHPQVCLERGEGTGLLQHRRRLAARARRVPRPVLARPGAAVPRGVDDVHVPARVRRHPRPDPRVQPRREAPLRHAGPGGAHALELRLPAGPAADRRPTRGRARHRPHLREPEPLRHAAPPLLRPVPGRADPPHGLRGARRRHRRVAEGGRRVPRHRARRLPVRRPRGQARVDRRVPTQRARPPPEAPSGGRPGRGRRPGAVPPAGREDLPHHPASRSRR